VIVGGGTGVELAGAIAELAYNTLKNDFRNINTAETRILLLEGMEHPTALSTTYQLKQHR